MQLCTVTIRTCTTRPVALYSFLLNLSVPLCVAVTLVVNLSYNDVCVTRLNSCKLQCL